MKKTLAYIGIPVAMVILAIFAGLMYFNVQAQQSIQTFDTITIGTSKQEVVRLMPSKPLPDTTLPKSEEGWNIKEENAVSALRYSTPVLLNSVSALFVFDENDILIAKDRRD